ncbi:MAG: hypothetical protein RLZZ242_385 [Bacteroidota bacterium]|jgi:cobalt-zinc-cadmium efflux system protein
MSEHHGHAKLSGSKLLWTILLNISITLAQFIGGILSGSMALLSDAVHNLSDVISLVVSYVANRLARRKATTDKTFGYKRAEIIAAFINATSLILIAVWLIYESILRLLSPSEIEEVTVIYLSLIAIMGNGLSVLLLKNQKENNLNIRSAYIHLFSDLLASVAVLIGALAISFFNWHIIDPILSIAISIYLIYLSYDLLKDSMQILMLYTPYEVNLNEVIQAVHAFSEVKKLHHIHIWKLNETEIHLEAHIDLNENLDLKAFNVLQQRIEQMLLDRFKINHITLQPEYNKDDSKAFIVQD